MGCDCKRKGDSYIQCRSRSSLRSSPRAFTVLHLHCHTLDMAQAKVREEITLIARGMKLTRLCSHAPVAALLPARVGQVANTKIANSVGNEAIWRGWGVGSSVMRYTTLGDPESLEQAVKMTEAHLRYMALSDEKEWEAGPNSVALAWLGRHSEGAVSVLTALSDKRMRERPKLPSDFHTRMFPGEFWARARISSRCCPYPSRSNAHRSSMCPRIRLCARRHSLLGTRARGAAGARKEDQSAKCHRAATGVVKTPATG